MKEKIKNVNLSSIILTITAIMVVSMILLRFTARMLRVLAMLFMQLAYGISMVVLIIAVIYLTIQAFKFYLNYNKNKNESE